MPDHHPTGDPDTLLASRLEALGRLVPGIAHELSTPAQYLGDNAHFLRGVWHDLGPILDLVARIGDRGETGPLPADEVAALVAAVRTADLAYLRAEVPDVIEQSIAGVQRVAALLDAVKAFARQDCTRQATAFNEGIAMVLTVAHNELKYVAEVTTDFQPGLPLVTCETGDVSLAVLHLLLAAARTVVAARAEGSSQRGRIAIATRRLDQAVELRISARGPVGERGEPSRPDGDATTAGGSGVATARAVIVGGHGGTLTVETEPGAATTWLATLPL